MATRKRCLLWDYKNTNECPGQMDKFNFDGPYRSVSNWNVWAPPELKSRAEFRPMVHDPSHLSGADWERVQNSEGSIVHFFNEPDGDNTAADQAAQQWQDQMVGVLKNQKGKKLVSPSCKSDDNGQNWVEEFMNKIQTKPDYLG